MKLDFQSLCGFEWNSMSGSSHRLFSRMKEESEQGKKEVTQETFPYFYAFTFSHSALTGSDLWLTFRKWISHIFGIQPHNFPLAKTELHPRNDFTKTIAVEGPGSGLLFYVACMFRFTIREDWESLPVISPRGLQTSFPRSSRWKRTVHRCCPIWCVALSAVFSDGFNFSHLWNVRNF